MDMKFTVGELAKLHNMSKQTLIYYDNIDLFKPNIVDKNNGYRYYTSNQLEILDSILILREIGIPIKDIKEFLIKRDNNKALKLLKDQKKVLDLQVKNLKRTITRLENKINTIESMHSYIDGVYFEEMESEYLAVKKVDPPFNLLQTDIAFKKLLTMVHSKKYPYNYQLGTIISLENLNQKEYTSADSVFFPLYTKLKGENILEKGKGLYAVSLHKGDYSSIGNTYEILIQNIKKNKYEIVGPSFEYCILDSLTSYTSKDYITKITIPVKAI